jgi:hypothetical protein
MAVDTGAGAVFGAVAGWAVSELAILPIVFHGQFEQRAALNDEKTSLNQSIESEKITLANAKNAAATGVTVDYTKLAHMISAQETRVSTINSTRVPFDTLEVQTDLITSGILAVLGIAASVATGIHRRKRQSAAQ